MDHDSGRSERRQVTVLFCDIADSTGLSERCDPEDLRDVLLEFQHLSTRCIEASGGKVINYIGDGIRAEFGYPLTSENEAESAVRAALSLLPSIKELSTRTAAALGETICVRIGIHTGVAVIGTAAAGHVHGATEIVGDTPNIAARLQEIGERDSIVISGETQRLLRGKFQLQALGARPLKGLSRQIDAFAVLGEGAADVPPLVRQTKLLPLVNRARELEQLLRLWELARSGQGQAVEIQGEAGIGKSRLAHELIERSGLPQRSIFELRASANHQNVPFYPVIRQLEKKVGIRRDDGVERNIPRLQQFLDESNGAADEPTYQIGALLGLPIPPPPTLRDLDPQEARRRTRELLLRLLTARGSTEPGIVLVEDLQWADPSTRDLVGRLITKLRGLRILLLITRRTEPGQTRDGSDKICRIDLARLENADCRELAQSAARGRQVPDRLLDRIVERCDGVPLFVEELSAAAAETGQLDAAETDFIESHEVPSALYDSLMIRLDRLGGAKCTAQLASVLGRTFSPPLLAAMMKDDAALAAGIAHLVESDLIRLEGEDPEPVYSFKHALVRDVAYFSLLRRERRELHARVAEAIETKFPELADAEPDYLAQHFSEAGLIAKAARTWLAAAARAAERSAHIEAIAQLRTALVRIANLPAGAERDALEFDVQLALVGPSIAAQGYGAPAVAEVSRRAVDLCRALKAESRIYPALYAGWSYDRVTGDIEGACRLAEEFLALAERNGTRSDRMVGHRLVGTSLLTSGEIRGAHAQLERALALYDAGIDQTTDYGTDIRVMTLSHLCITSWLLGKITVAAGHAERAMSYALEVGHAHTLGYAFTHLSMFYTLERDVDRVEKLARRVLIAATERELPFWAMVARIFIGWCETQSDRVAQGIETLVGQREPLRQANFVYWMPTYLCWLGEAYSRAGDLVEAKPCLAQARDMIGSGGERWYEPECWRIEGRLAEREEPADAVRARECFERALALAKGRGDCGFALRAAVDLARHRLRRGQRDGIRELIEQAMQPFLNEPVRGDRAEAQALLQELQD
ncbi:MAG: ATP-binding protein [Xanthobacteraceae bacterium]